MIPVAWSDVVALDLGALEAPQSGAPEQLTGIKADSRVVGPGDLFVGLNAGVNHVAEAAARGAATLVPWNQEHALARLASVVSCSSNARRVAIVGSTGKTSTKDILGSLCAASARTVVSEASQNNEIGVPLTVFRLEPETDILVTEMGMRGMGQIAALCEIVTPDVTVVTSIGPEHLELVGTVAQVAEANAEALLALPSGGVAVVPEGVPDLEPFLRREDIDVYRFDPRSVAGSGHQWRFPLRSGEITLRLPFTARHMAENTLAALIAYEALGLPLERAQAGADAIVLSRWRGEVHDLPGGGLVVNDAYNANPTSMRAALLDLDERAAGRRRVAILGEMAELGAESARYHEEIAALLRELEIEVVIGVGGPARAYLDGAPSGHWIPDAAAFDTVADIVERGDAILVKASRAVGLEGIPASIEKRARAWSES